MNPEKQPPPGFLNRALNRSLPLNLSVFCAFLREKGYQTSLADELNAARGLELIDLSDEGHFHLSLKTSLAKSHKELTCFDGHYEEFWGVFKNPHLARRDEGEEEGKNKEERIPLPDRKAQLSVIDWFQGKESQCENEEAAGYGVDEAEGKANLTGLEAVEAGELEAAIKKLGRKLANRRGRRYSRNLNRGELDLAGTLRKNAGKSDELIELAKKRRKPKKLKLDLICDVSKSMDLYSRFMVRFMADFKRLFSRIEIYVFGTQLYRVSEQLEGSDFDEILKTLGDKNPGWSGGTRTGKCLQRYLDSPFPPDRNTTVMIVSDGWDAGEIDLLEDSMREIRCRSRKIIWLNPLKSSPGYEPKTQGMLAALPFVDLFTSLHNLKSLEKLIDEL